MSSNSSKLNNPLLIYYVAASVSLLLSGWIAYRETVINPDAICYLQSAAVVGAGGLRKAMNLCVQAQWPFYSVLIYFLGAVTQLPLVASAYTWDAIFTAGTVIFFISLIRQLGGRGRVLWLAAFVILLAHQFNSIRQYIIRDHGFFTFYLLSLSLLLRYMTLPRWYYALGWGCSLFIATLFRIEGAVFLILLPWVCWFQSSLTYWQRVKSFLQLNALSLTAGLAVLGWLIFHPEISLASLGRIQDLVFQLFHAGGMVWQRFQLSADAFAHAVLTADSMQDAGLVFSLSMMMWYFVRVIMNLSPLYSGLVAYGLWRQSLPLNRSSCLVLLGYILSNVLITSLFLAQHLFLSKRYLIALTLILMLWVPFALDSLIQSWQKKETPAWLMPFIFLLLIIASIGGIFDFGYSKAYLRRAGDWLAENVSARSSLYSNDYQIMYYSKHFGNEIFQKVQEYANPNATKPGYWKNYDYVALHLDKKEWVEKAGWLEEIPVTPIEVFANKRGDQVVIYKIKG